MAQPDACQLCLLLWPPDHIMIFHYETGKITQNNHLPSMFLIWIEIQLPLGSVTSIFVMPVM